MNITGNRPYGVLKAHYRGTAHLAETLLQPAGAVIVTTIEC